MFDTSRIEESKPPIFVTPLLENLGFMSISLLFWLRDFVDRGALRLKKTLSRLLSFVYFAGSLFDSLFKQRWGTEARLQTLFWSGSCFPVQNYKEQTLVHSPAPDSELWTKAFELSLNKTPESCSSFKSSGTLDSLNLKVSDSCVKPCFEEAHNLPSFDNGLMSVQVIKSNPPTAFLNTNATLTRLAAKRRNEESRKRTQQRKKFAKWSNLRLRRSKNEIEKNEKCNVNDPESNKDCNMYSEDSPAVDQQELNSTHINQEVPASTVLSNRSEKLMPCALEPQESELNGGVQKAEEPACVEVKQEAPATEVNQGPQTPNKVLQNKRQRLKNVFKHSEE